MNADEIIDKVLERYDDSSIRITIKAENSSDVLMNESEKNHLKYIIEWSSKLFGNQDAVRISAAAHDWDRAFPEIRVPFENSAEKYWDYKIGHSINTANIFLDQFKNDLNPKLMSDVTYLIKRHEIGGKKSSDGTLLFNEDAGTHSYNLEEAAEKIQMADSISGFIAFLDKGPSIEARGEKYGLKKLGFYYGRAKPEAKEIIDSLSLSNPTLIRLFDEYKKKDSKDVQVINSEVLEEKFNRLEKDMDTK